MDIIQEVLNGFNSYSLAILLRVQFRSLNSGTEPFSFG